VTRHRISAPVVDLLRSPDGPRDRQLLFGDTVRIEETKSGWNRVIADKDGYTGWLRTDQLTADTPATHWITAPATHAYQEADFKSRDLVSLSFGSRIQARTETDRFVETELGYIPKVHTAPMTAKPDDPVEVAKLFLGTPYLWGGNSRFGIECVINFAIRMDAWTDNRLRSGGSQLDDHRSVSGIRVFFCGCSDCDVPAMRVWRGRTPSDRRGRWQVLIGKLDRFVTIEIDINQPTRWFAKDDSDVAWIRKDLRFQTKFGPITSRR